MSSKKTRWFRVYESSEEELINLLQSRNLQADCITGEAGSEETRQTPGSGSTVWCAEGSLSLEVGSAPISLQPGDTMHVEADTTYTLHAGVTGYVCYVTN